MEEMNMYELYFFLPLSCLSSFVLPLTIKQYIIDYIYGTLHM